LWSTQSTLTAMRWVPPLRLLCLKGLGKEASVYLRDTIPYRYEFLPCPENVIHQLSGEDVFETVSWLTAGICPVLATVQSS